MRVIAGNARGRRLKAPRGLTTRPASARARESIFSHLQVRLQFEGLRVLDIYAGSGSLGIEALSRGAADATFVDSSRSAGSAIRENLETFGLSSRGRIMTHDLRRALPELSRKCERFGLVFIDAPYAEDLSARVLTMLAELDLVDALGCVVIRQSRRAPDPPEAPDGFDRYKVAVVGDHRIAFYRRPLSGAEHSRLADGNR